MQTGRRIKMIRQNKKLSQQELANRLKYLTQAQISKLEKGNRKITALDLVEISNALDITVNELVK